MKNHDIACFDVDASKTKEKDRNKYKHINIFHIKSSVLMCTHRKVLSKRILMQTFKALALTVSKS